jgi:transglutaminase-like putative cysteine protease
MIASAVIIAELTIHEFDGNRWWLFARMVLFLTLPIVLSKAVRRVVPRLDRRAADRYVNSAVLILVLFPFLANPIYQVLGDDGRTAEILCLAGMRNMGLGLAAMLWRPKYLRAAAAASLFIVICCFAISDDVLIVPLSIGFIMIGSCWLISANWSNLARQERKKPHLLLYLYAIPLSVAIGLVSAVLFGTQPDRVVEASWGFIPSSGGMGDFHLDARDGFGDGVDNTSDGQDANSVGFMESDLFIESPNRPTMYDLMNDSYGEPSEIVKNDSDIAVSLKDKKMIHKEKGEFSDNEQAGREFTLRRKRKDSPRQPGKDHIATALIYVKGKTPLHLRMNVFDTFDGEKWTKGRLTSGFVRELDADRAGWLSVHPESDMLISAEPVAHELRIGKLKTKELPVPAHLGSFRCGFVNRLSFFQWRQQGLLRLVRWVPPYTTIRTESVNPIRDTIEQVAFLDTWRPNWREDAAPIPLVPIPADRAGAPSHPTVLLTPKIVSMAREWSDGTSEGWAQINAIAARLRSGCFHDPSAVAPAEAPNIVEHFLLESRRGPDYLFASAYVNLLCSLGYDARVVSGFYASPKRYDARLDQTLVSESDVHFWSEVRLPDGTWIEIDPTPGYAVMGPSPRLGDRVYAVGLFLAEFAASNAILLGVAAALAVLTILARRRVDNAVSTFRWRWKTWSSPPERTLVMSTLRLIERRSLISGRPRPASRTMRSWYSGLVDRTDDMFSSFIEVADWAAHAPNDSPAPRPISHVKDVCNEVVRAWNIRVLREL